MVSAWPPTTGPTPAWTRTTDSPVWTGPSTTGSRWVVLLVLSSIKFQVGVLQIGDFNWLSTDKPSPNWSILPETERRANWEETP